MSSCTNPLLAVRLHNLLIGKQSIKILPRRVEGYEFYRARYGKDALMELPCGHCPSCLSRRAKEWAVRCALEALDHNSNCFVTLTYDPEHYDKRDVKNDWKKFIKSLRNSGYKVRYFGCCESGDQYGRQHFHILLFGYFPFDARPWAKSEKGYMQYRSKFLDSIWKKGLLTVAEFSPYCAQYTAGYVVKKFALGDKTSFHFQSTRPGIGAGYFLRNIQDIYDDGKLILTFGSHMFSIPRYCDKLAENCGVDLSETKEMRLEAAGLMMSQSIRDHGFENEDRLIVHNEVLAKSKIRYQKRRF